MRTGLNSQVNHSQEKKNCLALKANEKVPSAHVPDVLFLARSLQPAAPAEDTPELSAFLRNSTIPHLVRKRDVSALEPHRQSPAKILVSCLSAQILDWTEFPNARGFNFKYCFSVPSQAQIRPNFWQYVL